jgi:hypothetical protein
MSVTPYVNESTDMFTPGCTVAHGRIGRKMRRSVARHVPRIPIGGNRTAFEHETSVLMGVEKNVWARAGASRSVVCSVGSPNTEVMPLKARLA